MHLFDSVKTRGFEKRKTPPDNAVKRHEDLVPGVRQCNLLLTSQKPSLSASLSLCVMEVGAVLHSRKIFEFGPYGGLCNVSDV